jgi:DNA-directed RNA polymerase subunit RPC12/RpoP
MTSKLSSERRRQFCARCGQLMFEYFRSPDGHFGLVDDITRASDGHGTEVRCPTCGARYRLLDRLDPTGQPVVRV